MAESLKFLTDENQTKAIAVALSDKGVDIERNVEIGMMSDPDSELLDYAVENNRIVITQDDDFLRHNNERLTAGLEHPGIFFLPPYVRGKKGIGTVVRFVLEACREVESGEKNVEDFYNLVTYVK